MIRYWRCSKRYLHGQHGNKQKSIFAHWRVWIYVVHVCLAFRRIFTLVHYTNPRFLFLFCILHGESKIKHQYAGGTWIHNDCITLNVIDSTSESTSMTIGRSVKYTCFFFYSCFIPLGPAHPFNNKIFRISPFFFLLFLLRLILKYHG